MAHRIAHRKNPRLTLLLGVVSVWFTAAAMAQAQTQPPASAPLPPPKAGVTDTAAVSAPKVPRTPIAASSGEPPPIVKDAGTEPLARLDDPPRLPPLRLAVDPAVSREPALIDNSPVVVEDVKDGAIRTGVKVTPRNGASYTLADPRQEGLYKQNEGSPLTGRSAVPRWQVLKW
jgi:hypothetical protein